MYRQTPIARTPCACYLEFQTPGWLDPSDERAILLLGCMLGEEFVERARVKREVIDEGQNIGRYAGAMRNFLGLLARCFSHTESNDV